MERVDIAKLAATAEKLRTMIEVPPVDDDWPDDALIAPLTTTGDGDASV